MAPLPLERVSPSLPFTHVGLDFTGHLLLKQKGSKIPHKAYVCIFTCASTRMVHSELTNDMSDNQSTLKRADKDLKWIREISNAKLERVWEKIDTKKVESELANKGIKWKFITERSPHRGGWWERICRSLKELLRKVLCKAFLSYVEMCTILKEIESMINSRPLTFIEKSIGDNEVITPAHLALGRALKTIPDVPYGVHKECSISGTYLYRQRLMGIFWKRRQSEYLPKLTVRHKWTDEVFPLRKGDVVFISEENQKRSNRPLGRLVEIHKGADGLIQTVSLKTKKGILNRSVQKLHFLEGCESQDNEDSVNKNAANLQSATKNMSIGSEFFDVVNQGGENVDDSLRRSKREKSPRKGTSLRDWLAFVFPCPFP